MTTYKVGDLIGVRLLYGTEQLCVCVVREDEFDKVWCVMLTGFKYNRGYVYKRDIKPLTRLAKIKYKAFKS